ncbi:MAG: hypothetical protein FJY07_11840 [Bacteroidetes bacterium]|nr:hypothetical protein [Bacteroidota bacterium]
MNLQKIEELIGKYERAETSLEEEKQLRAFFRGNEVAAHLQSYKEIFSVYDLQADDNPLSQEFDKKILSLISGEKEESGKLPVRRNVFTLLAIAAGITILFGIYFWFGNSKSTLKDTYDDPKLAYAETKKALIKVSATLNSGLHGLNKVSEFNNGLSGLNNLSAFETGMENIKMISILENTKETITTKN